MLLTGSTASTTAATLVDFYEEAMHGAANSATTPSFTEALAAEADFTEYCTYALPDVCTDYYQTNLTDSGDTVGLEMSFGMHFLVRGTDC